MDRMRSVWFNVTLLFLGTSPLLLHAQQPPWPDPVANDVIPYQSSGLTHGPMLGAVTSNSVRVWVRTDKPRSFRVLCDTRLPLGDDSPAVSGKTAGQRDNIGIVTLDGLQADARYYYAVEVDGELADLRVDFHDAWPSFRTLPAAESFADERFNPQGRFNLCFSVGCCASQEPIKSGGHYGSSPSFATLLKEHGDRVQFHLMNGDYIYEELRDGTMDGYRANYRRYLSRGRSLARMQRHIPFVYTFDDHETGGDVQGPGEAGVMGSGPWLLRDVSLGPWQEYCGWANYNNPHHAPVQYGQAEAKSGSNVLHDPQADFSQLTASQVSTVHVWKGQQNAGIYALTEVIDRHRLRLSPDFKHDETCRYSIGTHQYFDWQVGNCHFFALDTRGERTGFKYADRHDEDRYILGPAQRAWLRSGVEKSDADFIFIVSSVPWTIFHTAAHVRGLTESALQPKGDTFGGYLQERESLLEYFDSLAKPVIIFSGDVHNALSIQISDNVWEFVCGPLNSTGHPIATAGNPPWGGWFDSEGRKVKIKWVAGFPNNVHYSRLRSQYYAVVQVNNIAKSARPEGRGAQWIAYAAPQVVVRFHDGHTGKLIYAEGISTLDAQPGPE